MTWSEKDKERLEKSIAGLKSFIEFKIEEQRKLSKEIISLRLELACLEHCREEIL